MKSPFLRQVEPIIKSIVELQERRLQIDEERLETERERLEIERENSTSEDSWLERKLDRENWIEAKTIVRAREETYFERMRGGVRFVVLTNAGGLISLLGFAGSAFSKIESILPIVPSIVFFLGGLIAGGRVIELAFYDGRLNHRVATTSLIEAAHHDSIGLFNDTENGSDDRSELAHSAWKWSFRLFIAGVVVGAIGLFFISSESTIDFQKWNV